MFHEDLSCAIQNSKKLCPAVERLPNLRLLPTFTKKRATKKSVLITYFAEWNYRLF